MVKEVIAKNSFFRNDKIVIFVDDKKVASLDDNLLDEKNQFKLKQDTESVLIEIYNHSGDYGVLDASIPNAGGFPIQLLLIIIGAVFVIIGIIVRKKKSHK